MNGQSVHVAADEDGPTGQRALDRGQNRSAELTDALIGNADLVQLLAHELAGLDLMPMQNWFL